MTRTDRNQPVRPRFLPHDLVAGTRKSSLAGQLGDDLRMFATGVGPRNIRLDAEQVGASDPIGQPEPAELIEHRH